MTEVIHRNVGDLIHRNNQSFPRTVRDSTALNSLAECTLRVTGSDNNGVQVRLSAAPAELALGLFSIAMTVPNEFFTTDFFKQY